MDIIFWGSFASLFLVHLLVAKFVFRVYTPRKPLKECRDPSLQYWRFYMVQIANFRVFLSIILLSLTQAEQTLIPMHTILQLILQNIISSYALNLILDSIFHHTKYLSRFQQKTGLILALVALFSQSELVWGHILILVAVNELPNLFLALNMRSYPQNSIIFSFLFLCAFLAARYFLYEQIYTPFLSNPDIGIQFKVLGIVFQQCQLIWGVYFLERFFKQISEAVLGLKKLEESEKPKIYKQVRNVFQFLLRSRKGKFILGLGIFTAFFQKTVITVILKNQDVMIHF